MVIKSAISCSLNAALNRAVSHGNQSFDWLTVLKVQMRVNIVRHTHRLSSLEKAPNKMFMDHGIVWLDDCLLIHARLIGIEWNQRALFGEDALCTSVVKIFIGDSNNNIQKHRL